MFGPAYDRVIACIRQYDDTHSEHNPYVRYMKRVIVVVCRTVQLRRLFRDLSLLWLLHDDSQEMDKMEVGQLLTL